MTRSTIYPYGTEIQQFTISTWVYIPKEAVAAQNAKAPTLDQHIAPLSVRRRIPILQLGRSVAPREGIHIGLDMTWEGYLGFFWWIGSVGIPWFPDYLADYWVGGFGANRKGWFPFGGVRKAHPSVDPANMWTHRGYGAQNLFGTVAIDVGTAFYYMPAGQPWPGPFVAVVHYEKFGDLGIKPFSIRNLGPRGPYWASYPGGDHFGHYAKELSWDYRGDLRADVAPEHGRMSILEGDIAKRSIEVESEIFFTQFWDSPFNFHIQKTPTANTGPNGAPYLRVDTGSGTAKYFAYGDIVVMFPELENVTYATPGNPTAIPSTLYYDGDINFLLTAKWPEENTGVDGEIVPTMTFSASGFVLDSWNHIFLTVDMSTMHLAGGQDDKELTEWVETVVGRQRVSVPLQTPYMETPPKFAMFVNRKQSKNAPVPKLTVYPHKDAHWSSRPTFGMSIDEGTIGIPVIEQEKHRWKVTGPNQNIMFAYTHIYLGQYIEPTLKNLSKFVWKSKDPKYNFVIPPPDEKAAVKEFGKPAVWLYRDKEGGVEWVNQGTTGMLVNTGTKPADFRPGPGQPDRRKKKP